ncbi:MAG: hypothetical protein H7257_04680 [Taibaiella sp.]|nr:hypothetical protein [Taibaiella sp.]
MKHITKHLRNFFSVIFIGGKQSSLGALNFESPECNDNYIPGVREEDGSYQPEKNRSALRSSVNLEMEYC